MVRQILHIDVNNAFLSWTAVDMLKNGYEIDIRKIPSVIGGDESRRAGIVLAKSMVAKQFGVSTGEPIYFSKKKCPELKIFRGLEREKYMEYSNKLYNLSSEYTEKIERFSIDECFLDMTEYLCGRSLLDIAKEINFRVKNELGFTVNIGIAHNKVLAKMASDFQKPDRIHTLFEDEISTKMWPLHVSELFMLGKKSVPKLYNMGIKTIGDLAHSDKKNMIKHFGKHGLLMWNYANGIDDSKVKFEKELPKSIGNSITLPLDLSDIDRIEEILLNLTEQVTFRLRKYNMIANVVNVSLRTKDFQDFSHQSKLDFGTSNTKDIFKKAKELLFQMYKKGTFIRQVGMKVDGLENRDEMQLSFFTNCSLEKQEKLDKVVDSLNQKYGNKIIKRAGSMNVNESGFYNNSLEKKDI